MMRDKNKKQDEQPDGINTCNIAALSRMFDLDRATVIRRLESAGIQPVEKKARETLYEMTDEVTEALDQADAGLDAEKLRKLRAEADLKEAQVRQQRGELVTTAEVSEYNTRLYGGLYKALAVQMPRKIAAKLARSKSAKDTTAILQAEIGKTFNELRANHGRFLETDA